MIDPRFKRYIDEYGNMCVGPAGPPVCDFCLAPGPAWQHPAGLMALVDSPAGADLSDDEWAACESCHALIQAGDVDGLIERALDEQPVNQPPGLTEDENVELWYPPRAIRALAMRRNVEGFFAARSGEPVPYSDG